VGRKEGVKDSIPVKGGESNEEGRERLRGEHSFKVWIWIAVIDIVAIVITGLLIFSRHGQ